MVLTDETPRCGLCRFWPQSSYAEARGWVDHGVYESSNESHCRRNAPIGADDYGRAKWPRTGSMDFCGEFERHLTRGRTPEKDVWPTHEQARIDAALEAK